MACLCPIHMEMPSVDTSPKLPEELRDGILKIARKEHYSGAYVLGHQIF